MNQQQKYVHYSVSCTQTDIMRQMRKEALDDYISGNDTAIFRIEAIDEVNRRMVELSLEAAKILKEKYAKRDNDNS